MVVNLANISTGMRRRRSFNNSGNEIHDCRSGYFLLLFSCF